MAVTVDSFYVLRNYLTQLFGKANHHTSEVSEIALALIGGIIWRSTDEVQLVQHANEPVNTLLMVIATKNYCFVYNYDTKEIEMRYGDTTGQILAIFTNTTSIAEVKNIFKKL